MNIVWFWVELFQVTCRRAVLNTLQSEGKKQGLLTSRTAGNGATVSWDQYGAKSFFLYQCKCILSSLSDYVSNSSETKAMNEKMLWAGTVHMVEDLLWGKYRYDSQEWLLWWKNKVPSGDRTEEELSGRISFCGLWEVILSSETQTMCGWASL